MFVPIVNVLKQAYSYGNAMVYPLGNFALALYALAIVAKGKQSPFVCLNDLRVLFCYGALSALMFRQCASWADIHLLLSVAALPILTQYSAGFYPFQLANLFGIYKAISGDVQSPGYNNILSAVLHAYLLFASLDMKALPFLADLKDVFLCTDERRLANIQSARDIVFDDIKNLPERMRLWNTVNEFKYDVNESMFLLRAIVRKMWRPMLPLYIVSAIAGMLTIARSVTQNLILHILDFPTEYSWYAGYAYAILEAVLCACDRQLSTAEALMDEEAKHVINSLKLQIFRLPLLKKGLHKDNNIRKAQSNVDNILTHLQYVRYVLSLIPGSIATLVPLYLRVGWLALIPFGIALTQLLLRKGLEMVFGSQQLWKDYEWYQCDSKVSELYHNAKSIKMFGWERMYTDLKIQEYWKRLEEKKATPWYALILRFFGFVMDIFYEAMEKLSLFLMFYLHMQNRSGSSQPMSTVDVYWMISLVSQVQEHATWYIRGLDSVFTIVAINYNIERVLKGNHVNTLAQYLVDTTRPQDIEHGNNIDYSRPSVFIDNGAFSWNKRCSVLQDVTLSVKQGELVAVVGKTGSGKSSLLLSICGEVEMTAGTGAAVGSMALVEQTPWIMSGTLRENILFGRDYDEEYYNKVVFACALVEDISNWAKKDLTVIGERGINISGGQKARLALARAVYSRADIYILDDPLSAVDAHVKRHILDNVIMDSGLLAGKIRIVSTNMQSLLPYFDKVLSLDDNSKVSVSHNTRLDYQPMEESTDTKSNNDKDVNQTPVSLDITANNNDRDRDSGALPEITEKSWSNLDNAKFVLQLCGAQTIAIIFFSALFKPITRFIFDGYKVDMLKSKHGTSLANSTIQRYFYFEILKKSCTVLIWRIDMYTNGIISEKYLISRIKSMFLKKIINAPLSFFDSATRQEISSAYNNGSEAMAEDIPIFLRTKVSEIIDATLSIYRIGTNAPQLLIFVPPFVWALLNRESTSSSVNLSLEKIETKILISQEKVDNTIADGKRLIRIFNVEGHFTEKYTGEIENKYRVRLPKHLFGNYVGTIYRLWYRIICALCKMSIFIQAQIFRYNISSVELVTYTSMTDLLGDSISNIIGSKAQALAFKNKVEEFRRYMDIDGEEMFVKDATKPEEQWPSAGKIEFRNFSMKYREDLEHVLKDVNLTINPSEKIGIVGRTGAGKTSLTRALFRLIDSKTCSGSIVVDGQDIFSLNIGDLRPKLGIIPQEPTMFKGSFRQNLDPLVQYNIEDMWSAIIKCGIVENVQPKDARNSNDHIDENMLEDIEEWNAEWGKANWSSRIFLSLFITKPRIKWTMARKVRPHGLNRHAGDSFSDGQQQIFGLCRLLMRNRKIVVLDEATGNVDLETDERMQNLIRSEFKDCTVLTIAHRLETIMNSDRIIVMDNGRIAEIGSPTELLDKNGHFAELVKANDFGV